jgi:glycosyltransferase involved in cell wall biosynthesis
VAVRVGVVTCVYPPYRSGIGNVAARHAAQLATIGHEVEVLCPAYDGFPCAEIVDGVSVHRLRAVVRHGNSALVPALASRVRSYDALYVHYPFYGGAEPAAIGARLYRIPYVVFFHMDVIWGGVRGAVLRMHRRTLAPFILQGAHRVWVSSFDYAQNSTLAGARLGNLEEMPYAVNETVYAPGYVPPATLQRLGVDPGRPYILFVGAMDSAHAFKGVPELLRAFELVRRRSDAQLVLVGDGDLRPWYEADAAQRLGLGTACFAGRVDEADLVALYRGATATVLPSTTQEEAFGVVLVEGMACGAPAVASDLPGVRAVVRDGETGRLVAPGDVAALADALAGLLEDPELRRAYSEAALKDARTRFSRGRERQALAAAFSAIA